MNKILIISDIHIPTRMAKIQDEIKNLIQKYQNVIGIGDYISIKVVNEINKINKNFKAVYGNMDESAVRSALPKSLLLKIEGVTVYITHGFGAPFGMVEKILSNINEPIDVLLYGHTHEPKVHVVNGVYCCNPGALCDGRGSYGILTIDKNEYDFEINRL